MVEELVTYLKRCDDAYYNSDNVLVSNDTYDAMVETLRKLDPTNEYLKKVGSKTPNGTNKIGRLVPMGTLSKYHEEETVKKWLDSESGDILLSPKYDGFGVELIYEHCRLVMASTRGDGFVGEDVLKSILKIKNVPVILPIHFSTLKRVRGEVIIPRKNHEQIKSLGYTAMRNAVPGIVRSDRTEALMYVDFVAYEFFDGTGTRVAQRDYYSEIFDVEEVHVFNSKDFSSILEIRNQYGNSKDSYYYEIDGTVLKTNEIKEDDLSCPTHQIAWKFKSNRRETVLRGVDFNVGATGSISVTGIFDEVEFQGAQLKRASFGSLPLYEKMRPAIGDLIEVSRRGDIIPYVEELTVRNSDNYLELTSCPCCNTPLIDYKCSNKVCPERVKLKIYQYIKYIGVKGIGYALVVSMVDNGLLNDLSEIYSLNADEISELPRQGKSSVAKWRELQEKEVSTLELLCAYPFENAGKSLWKSLLDRYSLEEILALNKETLISANIKGIGESKIDSILSQLSASKEEFLSLLKVVPLR